MQAFDLTNMFLHLDQLQLTFLPFFILETYAAPAYTLLTQMFIYCNFPLIFDNILSYRPSINRNDFN